MGESGDDGALFTPAISQKPLPDISESATEQHQLVATDYKPYPGKWTPLLVLAGVVTTIGSSLPVGFNIGVVNTPADTIRCFCNESLITRFNVTLTESGMNILWSSIVSIFIIGGCIGSILGAPIAGNIGRKRAIYVVNGLALVGSVLFYFCRSANSVEMLLAGRFIVGLSGGLTMSVVPMYLTELAPLRLTGTFGILCPLGITFGVLLGQVMGLDAVLGSADKWPALLSIFGLLVLVCTPGLYFLPESPKYLYVIKSQYELAVRELERVRGVSATILTEELAQFRVEADVKRSTPIRLHDVSRNYGMLEVVRERRLCLPLFLVCSMQAGQQLSGINAVFYYSSSTFAAAGLDTHGAALATLGAGLANCLAALMALALAARARRSTMLWSVLGSAFSLTLLGISGALIESFDWMAFVSIAAMILYVLIYGLGLGPIPYFIASELFEVGPRPAAMSWGSLANWAGNFVVGMSFPSIQAYLGPYSFLIFSAITICLFSFLRAYLPETRGKSPSEVSALCQDGFHSHPLDKNSESKQEYCMSNVNA